MSESEPEIVQEIHQKATSLEDQVNELDAFGEEIEEFSTRIENMDDPERQAFYDNAEKLRTQVAETNSVTALLSLEEEVEEAIRAPLKQVALAQLERLLESLDPDLAEPTQEDIRDELSGRIAQDLESAADAYKHLIPTIQSLPDHLTALIAKSVEKTPSRLLAPEQELGPQVDRLQTRYQALTELDKIASNTDGVLSEVGFAETNRFYKEIDESIDVAHIEEAITEVETEVDTFENEQLDLKSIVSTEFEKRLAEAEVTEIETESFSILKEVRSVKRLYSQIEEYIEDLDAFGTSAGLFEDTIDELLARDTQLGLNQYSSLQHLKNTLSEFKEVEFNEFFENVHHRLQSQEKMMHVLKSEDGDPPPQIEFGEDGALLQVHIKENVLEALEACKRNKEWITQRIEFSSGATNQETILSICKTLSEGDEVELSEGNKEAVVELSDRLPLNVVLRSE